jgi:hypothetical protein
VPILAWCRTRSRPLLAAALVLLVLGSWAPFQLEPPLLRTNEARFVDDDVLEVAPPSLVRTEGPPSWLEVVRDEGAFVLRLDARTDRPRQDGPARLLSLSWDVSRRNLTLGQLGGALAVRMRHPGTDEQGQPQLIVPGVFTTPEWRTIEVRVDQLLEVSIDGVPVRRVVVGDDALAGWDPTYPLLFGDERTGGRGWEGQLRRPELTVAGVRHDLLTADPLVIPERYWEVPGRLTDPSTSRPPLENVLTGVLHTLIGLTIGALLALRRPARSYLATLTVWAAISVTVNLGKVVIATRHPSVATALLQLGGGGIGIALVLAALTRPTLDTTAGTTRMR